MGLRPSSDVSVSLRSRSRPRNAAAAFPPLSPTALHDSYKLPPLVSPIMEPGPSPAAAAAAAAYAALSSRRLPAAGSSGRGRVSPRSSTSAAPAFTSCRPSSRFADFALADSWPAPSSPSLSPRALQATTPSSHAAVRAPSRGDPRTSVETGSALVQTRLTILMTQTETEPRKRGCKMQHATCNVQDATCNFKNRKRTQERGCIAAYGGGV